MRRQRRRYQRSLQPTISGALVSSERHLFELVCEGDSAELNRLRYWLLDVGIEPDRSAAPAGQTLIDWKPRRFADAPARFAYTFELVDEELVPSRRSYWWIDDLAIRDSRIGRAMRFQGGPSRYTTPSDPLTLRFTAEADLGVNVDWPPELRADDWGFIAEGETWREGIPRLRGRPAAQFDVTRRTPSRPTGRPAKWLKAILGTAGDEIVPTDALDAEGVAELEAGIGPLPTTVKQFVRWSDGATWDWVEIDPSAAWYELDGHEKVVVIGSDVSGDVYALDLNRATRDTCPVGRGDHETGTLDEAGSTFEGWLRGENV